MLNNIKESDFNLDYDTITNALGTASQKIAPLWPLESFVAVNPYLGLSGHSFESTARSLSALAGIQTTMTADYYLDAIKENKLQLEDLKTVLYKRGIQKNVQSFIKELRDKDFKNLHNPKVKTVAEVAQKVTTANWPDFMVDSISSWAASYFDSTQTQWKESKNKLGLFAAWKIEAETNRSPSLMGLQRFHKLMKTLPNNHIEAIKIALDGLGIQEHALPVYLHSLLLRLGGWSSYLAHFDWDDKRYSREGAKLIEFLSVLICWEYGIYNSLKNPILDSEWKKAKTEMKEFGDSQSSNQAMLDLIILQEAYDLTAQRSLIQKFKRKTDANQDIKRPKVQAVFCIDVRSEVYRRNLESVAPEIDTLGFAGFFGFPINFRKLGHDEGFDQCPALIPSGYTVIEKVEDKKQNDKVVIRRKLNRAFKFAWKSFKSSAISSFGFVSPLGLSLLPKLFTDSFGWTRPVPHPHKNGLSKMDIENLSVHLDKEESDDMKIGIPLADRVNMAKGALQAMSLTDNFARVVMIVGHGSSSVNNPHASGLDCGACAGQSGEANAKVAAIILNDNEVRRQLAEEKIYIPDTTYFLACLHDTTLDEVSLFNTKWVPDSHQQDLEYIKQSIQEAGKAARAERVLRMSMAGENNVDAFIKSRSNDWSQVRPEWGLAGCSSFVVAPRHITRGLNLEGRAFLHSYNWKDDKGFNVLEAIMTAPMIVTSWINLQYYASTVDNKHFGSGNKTLHNVTSGIGVLEGYAGDLRSGLPMQSIHDGVNYQHEPLRLNVVINAPKEAVTKILEKHDSVRQLVDNQWIFLMAMNDFGEISDIYDSDLMWRKLNASETIHKQSKNMVEEFV
ncbi:YbcC family protein [Marivirga sp.]|uniref:YbcC family protein n=1 Tax=Marivirga sp. TaxID=2018662 RepID=UPI003DA76E89